MSRRTRLLVALVLVAAPVLGSACSGDDAADDAVASTTTEAAATDTEAPAPTEPDPEQEPAGDGEVAAPPTDTVAPEPPAGDEPVVIDIDGTDDDEAVRRAAYEGMVSAEQLACLFPSAQPGAPAPPSAGTDGCGLTASQGFAAELYLSVVAAGGSPAQATCMRGGVAGVPIEQVQGGGVDLAALAQRCGVPPELLGSK